MNDEVDNIIIHTLRAVGCNIPEEVRTVAQFDAGMVVEGVSVGLHMMNEELAFPTELPSSMSAKVRLCNALAEAVKELGYRGEIGYASMIYTHEKEVRDLFVWLSQYMQASGGVQASVEGAAASADARSEAKAQMMRAIKSRVGTMLKRESWRSPRLERKAGVVQRGSAGSYKVATARLYAPGRFKGKSNSAVLRYLQRYLPLVTLQPPDTMDVAPSILEDNKREVMIKADVENEWNTAGLESGLSQAQYWATKRKALTDSFGASIHKALTLKKPELEDDTLRMSLRATHQSLFVLSSMFKTGKDNPAEKAEVKTADDTPAEETEEEKEAKRAALLADLQAQEDELAYALSETQRKLAGLDTELLAIQNKFKSEVARKKELEAAYTFEKKVFDALEDPDTAIAELTAKVGAMRSALLELAARWEGVRAPLVAKIRELRSGEGDTMIEINAIMNRIRELRDKMAAVMADGREQEGIFQGLLAEYKALDKNVTRSHFTKRILDLVAQIKKQAVDISKVLVDTRAVQKDINTTTETLKRTFSLADERIYADAPTDPHAKAAYRGLASLHENFGELTETVRVTGRLRNEIQDLDAKYSKLADSNASLQVERLEADYTAIRTENKKLIARLKAIADGEEFVDPDADSSDADGSADDDASEYEVVEYEYEEVDDDDLFDAGA